MNYHLNSSTKVFVFDFDGTLLNSEVRISPRTFEALKSLKSMDIPSFCVVVVCTLLCYLLLKTFCLFLKGYAHIVSYNGGYIVNNKGELLFEKGLDKDVAIDCIEFCVS